MNGRSHGFIKPSRGLRQGDPLSPFLFILGAEALVSVLNQTDSSQNITGMCFSPNGPSINHFLFADDSLMVCKVSLDKCGELLRCLELYCKASGQQINYQKSSIIFGAEVLEEEKAAVKDMLGIHIEGGDVTYLGLPESFSGSKQQLLSFIHKKLKKRLDGWFSKALSQGGKEILLKSIALALPVYAMSCFKLTKGLCDKLKSAMIEYWWSSGNNRRKISWVTWEKLCLSKEDGGLGFHDITLFNQALLCKQAWRLMDNPNSLVASFLRSRYYVTNHFLVASLGARPSYAWRSILFGRELLLKGVVRTIGNGCGTYAFIAKWIFNGEPRAPIRTNVDADPLLRVVDLINTDTGTWRAEEVHRLFVPPDAITILSMKISMSTDDSFVWGYTKHGRYTSQSGYKLLASGLVENQVHTTPIERALWKKVWKLKTPPKLRHFIWKILHEALAVADRLQTRGINIPSLCPMCRAGVETVAHVLFTCSEARRVWDLSGLVCPANGFSSSSVFVNIHFLVDKMSRTNEDTIDFFWVLWHIWKARNSFVFEHFKLSPETVFQRATESAIEWKTVHGMNDETNPLPAVSQSWSRPKAPYRKCNVACYRPHASCFVGLAWVLRNANGEVVFHARVSFAPISDGLQAELRCLLWIVTSLVDLRQSHVVIELSSKQAIEAVQSISRFPAYRLLLEDIRSRLAKIASWSLSLAPPSCNSIAIKVAKSASTEGRAHSYIQSSAPSWLSSEIAREAQTS